MDHSTDTRHEAEGAHTGLKEALAGLEDLLAGLRGEVLVLAEELRLHYDACPAASTEDLEAVAGAVGRLRA